MDPNADTPPIDLGQQPLTVEQAREVVRSQAALIEAQGFGAGWHPRYNEAAAVVLAHMLTVVPDA